MKKMIWFISITITSFLGYIRLKNLAVKNDNEKWKESFCDRNVLIVGTGPSLDKVDEDYFKKFDVIVYINHAIKISGNSDDEYFFTTDVGVVKDIMQTSYYKNILMLGDNKSIVAPIFFQQVLMLSESFIDKFTWIKASEAKFTFFKRKLNLGPFKFTSHFPPSYWPQQPGYRELDIWFDNKDQVNYFPVIESTSALSAILFASKYRPRSIRLIGCDFGDGRAELVKKTNQLNSPNVFNGAKEKYEFIEGFLSSKGIECANDSWKF